MYATIDMTKSIPNSKSPPTSDNLRYKSISSVEDDVNKKDVKDNDRKINKSKERLKSMASYTIEPKKPQCKNIEKEKEKDITDVRFYTLQPSKINKTNEINNRNTPNNEMAQKDLNKKQINKPKSSNSSKLFKKIECVSSIRNITSSTAVATIAVKNSDDRRKSLNTVNEAQNISMSMINIYT